MDIASLVENKKNTKIPDMVPGDTVKVSARIVEAGKERIQVFQGVVIKIKRGGAGASFTVRHVAFGIGVERTFPYLSPLVEKVEIVRHGKTRRAKLYYLRGLSGKAARRKIKRVERVTRQGEETLAEEALEPEEALAEEPAAIIEEVAETAVGQPEAEEAKQPEAEASTEAVAAAEAATEAVEEKAPAAVVEAEAPVASEEKPEENAAGEEEKASS